MDVRSLAVIVLSGLLSITGCSGRTEPQGACGGTTACASGDGCCPSGCTAASDGDCPVACGDVPQLEQEMAATLDAVATDTAVTTDPDFTVGLQASDGRRFVHSHGDSSISTSYESASTSKLVSAVVVLSLVDQGYLSLDSKPRDLIGFWTGESSVALRDLLSFTSGFYKEKCAGGEPTCLLSCLNNPDAIFESCVQDIYDANIGLPPAPPGTEFYYASTHLQIAGLMAVEATGKAWSTIFSEFATQTGLFANSTFDLPSTSNPRLAGGMHWTADDYMAFLEALYWNRRPSDGGSLLTASSRDALLANQRAGATVESSPVWDRLAEDWSYGLGNWLECPTATTLGGFDCGSGHRNSSPGAYGAYPFIDFDYSYFGIVARESPSLGTFPEGVAIFREIQPQARLWATPGCGG